MDLCPLDSLTPPNRYRRKPPDSWLESSGIIAILATQRLIEFGQFADRNRRARGDGKPETFNFLGFTHSCAKKRNGRFTVLRQTMRTRWQASDIGRLLGSLAFRTRHERRDRDRDEDNAMHIFKDLKRLDELLSGPHYRQLADFRLLREADSEFSAQAANSHALLERYADSDCRPVQDLKETLLREERRIAAIRTQDMLSRAFESIRLLTAGITDPSLAAQLDLRRQRPPVQAPESLFRGRQLYRHYPTQDSVTWFIPRSGTLQKDDIQADIEQRGLFGVTQHSLDQRTVFWASRLSVHALLRCLEAGSLPGVPILGLVAITIDEKAVGTLSPAGPLSETLERVVVKPLRALQLELAHSMVFTWEAVRFEGRRRPAFCSLGSVQQ